MPCQEINFRPQKPDAGFRNTDGRSDRWTFECFLFWLRQVLILLFTLLEEEIYVYLRMGGRERKGKEKAKGIDESLSS